MRNGRNGNNAPHSTHEPRGCRILGIEGRIQLPPQALRPAGFRRIEPAARNWPGQAFPIPAPALFAVVAVRIAPDHLAPEEWRTRCLMQIAALSIAAGVGPDEQFEGQVLRWQLEAALNPEAVNPETMNMRATVRLAGGRDMLERVRGQ